jgi:hypothetical protein
MSRHQTARQNHNIKTASRSYSIKIANRFFENVTKVKYLGKRVTNKNLINGEIKSRLNSNSVCFH